MQPIYGFIDDERPRYCKKHRLQGMNNIHDHNRGCEIKNCAIIRATFGLPHDKKPSRCAAHRTNQMIDIVPSASVVDCLSQLLRKTTDVFIVLKAHHP